MKNSFVIILSGLVMALGLAADDPLFLIKTPSQLEKKDAFVMKRDLFRIDSTIAVSPTQSNTDPMAVPEGQTEPGAAQPPVVVAPTEPPVDLVLLGTILRQNKRCALFSLNGEIEVVEEGQTMTNGWLIEKITTTRVTVKTEQSSMMLALEGEEHE